jgi:hypothetical protein
LLNSAKGASRKSEKKPTHCSDCSFVDKVHSVWLSSDSWTDNGMKMRPRVIVTAVAILLLICASGVWWTLRKTQQQQTTPKEQVWTNEINTERIRQVEEATGIAIWRPYIEAKAVVDAGFRAADTQEVAAVVAAIRETQFPGNAEGSARREAAEKRLRWASKWNKIIAKYYCDGELNRWHETRFELKGYLVGSTADDEMEWALNLLLPAVWSDNVGLAHETARTVAIIIAYGDGREVGTELHPRKYMISAQRREEVRRLLLYEMENARTKGIRLGIGTVFVRAGYTNDMSTNILNEVDLITKGLMIN